MAKKAFVVKTVDYSQDETLPGSVFTQKRTITSWINYTLQSLNIKIKDLRQDLKDGLVLIHLLELLTTKTLSGYSKKPRIKAQLMVNCQKVINFLKEENIVITGGITPDDICDGNLKGLLNLMWNIIQLFHINQSKEQTTFTKSILLSWIQKRVEKYGCYPKNFNTDWSDGDVIYALADSLKPGKLDWEKRTGNPLEDTQKAMEFASSAYSIPMLMDPMDLVQDPDDTSLLIYLTYFKKAAEGKIETKTEGEIVRWYAEQLPKPNKPTAIPSKQTTTNGQKSPPVAIRYEQPPPVNIPDVDFNHTFDLGDNLVWVGGPGLRIGQIRKVSPIFIKLTDRQHEPVDYNSELIKINFKGPEEVPKEELQLLSPGFYVVYYRPKSPGKYVIYIMVEGKVVIRGTTAIWNEEEIEEEVKKVPILDPSKTELEFLNCKESTPTTFVIVAKDSDGNKMPKGGDKVEVELVGGDGEKVNSSVTDTTTGKYVVKFTPGQVGEIKAHVKVNDTPIPGSPFSAHVIPEQDVICSMFGSGLNSGITGQSSTIILHTHDSSKKSIPVPPSAFTFPIAGRATLEPEIKKITPGVISVTFVPPKSGQYTFSPTIYGKPLKNYVITVTTDDIAFVPSTPDVDMPKCKITNFLQCYPVNKPIVFQVELKGKGKEVDVSGGWEVYAFGFVTPRADPKKKKTNGVEQEQWKGLVSLPGNVRYLNGGVYEVTFIPTTLGSLDVDIAVGEYAIPGSPYATEIVEEIFDDRAIAIDPKNCWIEELSPFRMNSLSAFRILTKNPDGTPNTKGGEKFQIVISDQDGDTIPSDVIDNLDGTYFVSFSTTKPGALVIAVSVHGSPIHGSPFNVDVLPANLKCEFNGPNIEGGNFRYGPLFFQIAAYDENDNPFDVGADIFEIKSSGPGTIAFDISTTTPGLFDVQYQPDVSGNYILNILTFENTIGNLIVNCTNHPELMISSLSGRTEGFVNIPVSFDVQLKERDYDSYGKPFLHPYIAQEGEFSLVVAGAETQIGNIVLKKPEEGIYNLSYVPRNEGLHVLSIKYIPSGTYPIKDIISIVVQASDPLQCFVEGLEQPARVDSLATFHIIAKNRYGKLLSIGGEPFKVLVKTAGGENLSIEFNDNKNGEYLVGFVPPSPGDLTIDISVYDKPISGSPYTVTAFLEPHPVSCILQGAFHEIGDTDVPDLSILCRDRTGKTVHSKLTIPFVVDVLTSRGAYPLQVTQNNTGTSSIIWDPRAIQNYGEYVLNVKLRGEHIQGSPMPFKVKQGVDPLYSTVEFVCSRVSCELVVKTFNKHAEPQVVGGEKVDVEIVGQNGVLSSERFHVEDLNNGSYKITFEAHPGEYKVYAKIYDLNVKGSPFSVVVPPITYHPSSHK